MVRVYINKDSENNITSINSEIFLSEEEMSTMTEIDKGKAINTLMLKVYI